AARGTVAYSSMLTLASGALCKSRPSACSPRRARYVSSSLQEVGRMIRTRFTETFKVDAPIMSAPMGLGLSSATLASAGSEGGGLGRFAGVYRARGAEWLRSEIARVRALTSKPFGVGFITHFLSAFAEYFAAALDARVPVVALSFAPVEPWMSRAHAAGARVICQVQTMELVHDALAAGADAIAVQGHEAGGHTGTMGLLSFLTRVLDISGDTPVLAAGGIAHGRALAAVLAAGADGGLIGTPFLATPEATDVPDEYKQLVVDSDGEDTVF